MAITASTRVLYDGVHNVVIQLTGYCGDAAANETNELKVDVTALTPPCVRVSVMSISSDVQGGSITLAWQAQDPEPFAELSGLGPFDYSDAGGLANDLNSGVAKTGNIVLSTHNFDVGSAYTVKLDLKKKFS